MFREMRRFKQQLPEETCIEILRREPRGFLAVLGDEGYPYTFPINFIYEDGKIYFHCGSEGHKVDAIKKCDKVSFCVIDKGEKSESWSYYFNSVIVFGRIRMLEDREEVLKKARFLAEKYFPTEEEIEDVLSRQGHRVQCLELTIEHMTGKRVHEK